MCKLCRYCGGYVTQVAGGKKKWKPKYQRRKKRVAPTRKVQKKQKTKLRARMVKKNVLKIHASTQATPVPQNRLSPLYVKSCKPSRTKDQLIEHSEITPQMIHQALRELSLWRCNVKLNVIFEYILNHFPVNKNKNRLKAELIQKLQIAQLTGMVSANDTGGYHLHSSLEGLRQLPKALVTLFWEMYCNTMNPLQNKSGKNMPVFDPNNKGKDDTDSDSPPEENGGLVV